MDERKDRRRKNKELISSDVEIINKEYSKMLHDNHNHVAIG